LITSTWRTNHTIEQLQQIFTEQGIEVPIYDYTPHLDQEDRGLEIRQWLMENVDCIDWLL
jgi:aspartate/tyrosine/aromatic aminotransferase